MEKFRLIVFLLTALTVSCSEDDETQFIGGTCSNFEIEGVEVENLKLIDSLFSSDNVVEENSNVKWNEFLVRYRVKFEGVAIAQKNLKTSLSCAIAADVGLDTLYVKTLFDYNEAFSANDTINDIISLNFFHTSSLKDFDDFMNIEEYIDRNRENVFGGFDLKLDEAHFEETTPFSLAIDYVLNDGQVFTDTTRTVNLFRINDLE